MVLSNLIKLHPTKFYSLSEIMYLHVRHFYMFLFRLKIPSTFSKQNNDFVLSKKSLKMCIIWTGLNWVHIIWNIFLFFHFLPEYEFLSAKNFGVSDFSRFSLMMTSCYFLMEYIWYTQFMEMLSGENKSLSLVKEYSYKLDSGSDLSRSQINLLLTFFNRQYPLLQMYLILVFGGLGFFFGLLVYQFVKSHFTYNVKLWNVLVYILAAAYSNIQGIVVHVFALLFVLHLSFMIKIFKCKLINCEEWLKMYSQSGSKVHFIKFNLTYIILHRSLNMYNVFCSKFIYMCDLACKLGGSITFSVFYAEGNLQKNQIGMTMVALFAVSYLAMQLVYTIFAYFPEKNLAIYKSLSSLNAYHFCATNSLKKKQSQNSMFHRENLRHFLRVNSLIQTLAKNRFGFSYSTHFLILKTNVVENAFANFYFLVLFVKKFV